MIFHKVSRLVCGDHWYADNAHDIAGYATLLEEYINQANCNPLFDESIEEGQHYQLIMLICQPQVLLESPFNFTAEQMPQCLQKIFTGDSINSKSPVKLEAISEAIQTKKIPISPPINAKIIASNKN